MKLRPGRKEERRAEAKKRQAAYNKLTPAQKLAKLDAKFGKGQGAQKQRARLAERMS